jgi:ribonuclease HI
MAFVDGGCTGNGSQNGKAYGSYHVYDVTNIPNITPQEAPLRGKLVLDSGRIDINANSWNTRPTNNLAEAVSMMLLLTTLNNKGLMSPKNTVDIYCDSELVLNQLMGVYRTKNPSLLKIHQGTYDVIHKYEKQHNTSWHLNTSLNKISGDDMKLILGH